MTNDDAKPLRKIVGGSVRRVREAEGRRQEDISTAARKLGLAWPRSKVAALERGEKSISAEELLLLPSVLRSALGRPFFIAELFDSDEEMQLSPGATMPARQVIELLSGADAFDVEVHLSAAGVAPLDALMALDARKARRRIQELGLGSVRSSEAEAVERASGESERKAARSLGEDETVFVLLSSRLWGRSLSEERDARVAEGLPSDASARTTQARRGHVTRELIAEARRYIDQAGER